MIRALLSDWDVSKPISQIITDKGNKYPENISLLTKLADILFAYNPQVLSTPMIGSVTNKLHLDEIDKLPVKMAVVFDDLCRDSHYLFDVVDYMVYTLYVCLNNNLTDDMINTVLSRSLRSFPSFMRELDLRSQVKRDLGDTEVEHSIELDMKAHADLYFKYKEVDYYVWSYTNTNNARRKAMDKFIGNRGVIPNGVHVLAPFSLWSSDDINGWKLYKNSFIKDLTSNVINGNIDADYQSFCKNSREDNFGKLLFIKK